MPNKVGPNTVNDSIVFNYDTGDVANSYIGEPTTNLASGLGLIGMAGISLSYIGLEYGWLKYSMSGTFTGGGYPYIMYLDPVSFTGGQYYSTQAIVKTNVPTKFNYFGASGVSYVNEPKNAEGTLTQTTLPDGSSYVTRSGFAYTNTTAQPGYLFTNPINNTTFDASTDFVYLKNFQIEQKYHCTQYTPSSRSATQGLLDISGTNNTITLATSYDNNAQPYFDATDDFMSLGSDVTFKTTGGWTVESIVYYNGVAGNYNNTTSPANFIGAEDIIHNSWYWSVLENKLALWNISPGYWRYGSTILQPNRWYYVALVSLDGGTNYQFYLNGVAEGGDHVAQIWNPNYSGLRIRYIGKGNNSNPRLVNGRINVTKVYNRALTSTEIQKNYSQYKTRFNLQ